MSSYVLKAPPNGWRAWFLALSTGYPSGGRWSRWRTELPPGRSPPRISCKSPKGVLDWYPGSYDLDKASIRLE